MCASAEKRCVFDIDDDMLNIDGHSVSQLGFAQFTAEARAALETNLRAAHVVTVTTARLAERISALNPNVHVVPNRVPRWLTERRRPQPDSVTVGWGGGSAHNIDWVDVAPRIGRFLTRNPNVHFHAIGVPGTINFDSWPRSQLRHTGWAKNVEDYYRLVDFDIGVAPLKPHPFNQSRSAVKALEYGALGIPIVASAYTPYENHVKHGETGFLVRRDHEWAQYLRDLTQDPAMRAEMGENARRQAKQHTIEDNLESWFEPWGVGAPRTQPARSPDEIRLLEGLSIIRHLWEGALGAVPKGAAVQPWLEALLPEEGAPPSEWLKTWANRARDCPLHESDVAASADVVERLVAEARDAGERELAQQRTREAA
jgi:hypothetical protein